MSRDSSRVVRLAELQRYVFTDEYNPQMTPEGAHELTFIESNGTSLWLLCFLVFFLCIHAE